MVKQARVKTRQQSKKAHKRNKKQEKKTGSGKQGNK